MNKLLGLSIFFIFCYSFLFASDKYLLTECGESRLHIFENEQVAVLSSEEDSILASSDGKYFSRSEYDKKHKLISKILWENKGEDSIIVSRLDYNYNENMSFPKDSTFINYKNMELVKTTFTQNGLTESEKIYILLDKTDFNITQLKTEIHYEYNTDSLITQKTIHTYNNNLKTKTEKYVYQTPGKDYAGYDYYVNEKLQRSIVYSSENEYTDTSYFSNNQYVVASYSGGRLLKEEFFSNSKNIDRR